MLPTYLNPKTNGHNLVWKITLCLLLFLSTEFLLMGQVNFISPSHPNIQYIGRIDFTNPNRPVFSYPGTSIKAKFSGTRIKVVLKDLTPGALDSAHYYAVILDSLPFRTIRVSDGDSVFTMDGLTNTNHTIEIFKRTESLEAANAFGGWYIDGTTLLTLPAKPTRKIEFIGDSWTCGYGNELSNDPPVTGFSAKNENNYAAWGAIVARKLNAQYQAVAISGRGLYRNNSGSTNGTLPLEYDKIHPFYNTKTWNTTNYVPDVVVIKLGTNDFYPEAWAVPSMLDSASFTSTYINFIQKLRGYYPNAKIIVVFGSSISDWWPANLRRLSRWKNYTQAIVSRVRTLGDAQVFSFELSTQTAPYGEDWHPTKATHQDMADQILSFIKTKAGWQDPVVLGSLNDPNIRFDGILNPQVTKDSVVFDIHNPQAYADATSGIVYFPCNMTRYNQSGIRIRFKTSSPTIQVRFSRKNNGYFALTNPQDGFTVYANGQERQTVSSLNFALTTPSPGIPVVYEISLPNLFAVTLKGLTLENGQIFEDPGANSKLKYAAFGTSITQGTGQYVSSAKTYPYKLARARDWNLFNFAVAGSTIGWQLAYDVKDTPFDVITVEQGYNDWASAYAQPLATVTTTYARFVDSLRYFQPKAAIYCIAPFFTSGVAAAPKYTLAQFRQAVQQLVAERRSKGDTKLYFIDGSSFTNASMLDDGVHLNVYGADTVAKALLSRVFAPSTITGQDESALNETNESTIGAVYPNPTTSSLTIPLYQGHWKLWNSQGQFILEGIGEKVPAEQLEPGVYFLEIEQRRIKILKQ